MSDPSQIGEAFVRIRPKANPGEFQRETEQTLGPAAKASGESLSRTLGDAIAVSAVAAFSTSVVRSAAEAEQAVGGTAAVFKDAAGEIDEFASTSAEALGLTEQATRQFSSQIGSALKGYGFSINEAADTSQKLITKGADLTALFGGTVPEAVTAMSAALRGEFDPLERYGVSLTAAAVAAKAVELGLAESTSAVDGHAKAVATLAIIEEQTADATGQFNRELGTAAGQMSVATAKLGDARDELGSQFLPVVTKAAGAVSVLADAFGALPGPVQASVAAIVALVALQGPIGRTKEKISEAAASMREGGEAATGFKRKLDVLARTAVLVGGIAAITGAIESFKAAQQQETDDFLSSLPDTSDIQGYRDAVNVAIERHGALQDELSDFETVTSVGDQLEAYGAAWDVFTAGVTGNVSAVAQARAEYDALSNSLPAAKQKAEELTDRVNELAGELGVTGSQAADFVSKFEGLDITQVPLEKLIKAYQALASGTDPAQVAEDLGVAVSTAGDKAEQAAEKLDDLRSGLFGLIDATNAYEDSIVGVEDAEISAARAAQGAVDARRAQQQAILAISDAIEAERDAQQGVIDAEQRRIDSLAGVEDAIRAVEDAQRRLTEAQQGPTESDNLGIEAAELRLQQMRKRLADPELDQTERRLQEIAIREAEIALAEKRAEIDGRAVLAQEDLTEAQDRLAESERGADAAARAVTDARDAQRDAAQGVADANYNAQRAADAVTTADRNAEKASRDVERAKYDQLKASEEMTKKLGEETAAFAGANEEAGKLFEYFQNLVAIHPELASAIQPLLFLLAAAKNQGGGGPPREGGAPGTGTGGVGPQTQRPIEDIVQDVIDGITQDPNTGGRVTSPVGNNVTQINNNYGVDIREAQALNDQRLARAVGW